MVVWLMIAYMLCYMPTLGLGNTITFTHMAQEDFPKVRVWGTIGWIAAGLFVGGLGWSASLNIFWVGAVSSFLLALYCFTLPHTPPPAKGKPFNASSLFMLDALKLLKKPQFFIFALCSTLICIPLAYYFGQTAQYLSATGFKESASTMTLGQMSEILFMVLIPFFFRRLGVKKMLLIGMLCWVARYALFAFGASHQITSLLIIGVLLHGICYDFFFVTGFIYTDRKAPADIRGQAQGLLIFLTQGIGMFFGFRMAFGGNFPFTTIPLPNTFGIYGAAPTHHQALMDHIKEISGSATPPSFLDSLLGMFGKGYPEGLDSTLLASAMKDWQNYWLMPASFALAVAVIFALTFRDHSADSETIDKN